MRFTVIIGGGILAGRFSLMAAGLACWSLALILGDLKL